MKRQTLQLQIKIVSSFADEREVLVVEAT